MWPSGGRGRLGAPIADIGLTVNGRRSVPASWMHAIWVVSTPDGSAHASHPLPVRPPKRRRQPAPGSFRTSARRAGRREQGGRQPRAKLERVGDRQDDRAGVAAQPRLGRVGRAEEVNVVAEAGPDRHARTRLDE